VCLKSIQDQSWVTSKEKKEYHSKCFTCDQCKEVVDPNVKYFEIPSPSARVGSLGKGCLDSERGADSLRSALCEMSKRLQLRLLWRNHRRLGPQKVQRQNLAHRLLEMRCKRFLFLFFFLFFFFFFFFCSPATDRWARRLPMTTTIPRSFSVPNVTAKSFAASAIAAAKTVKEISPKLSNDNGMPR
jgi:hypothetical protein